MIASRQLITMSFIFLSAIFLSFGRVSAQEVSVVDSVVISEEPSPDAITIVASKEGKKQPRNWDEWRPKTKRAMWLSVFLPGAGQVYNRKYWKLPIIYGGFVGCAYAIKWNNMMYRDYSQAYLDIMDDDPATQSYNQFLHLGSEVTDENSERYANIFKRRKDYYRRYRDLSYIITVGVYALQIVDAYVDAALSDFDINDDLSLSVSPTILTTGDNIRVGRNAALGLRCCVTF